MNKEREGRLVRRPVSSRRVVFNAVQCNMWTEMEYTRSLIGYMNEDFRTCTLHVFKKILGTGQNVLWIYGGHRMMVRDRVIDIHRLNEYLYRPQVYIFHSTVRSRGLLSWCISCMVVVWMIYLRPVRPSVDTRACVVCVFELQYTGWCDDVCLSVSIRLLIF